MSTVAWFNCFGGIAGDMALGSLIDAGADVDEVRQMCEHLPVGGWSLDAEPVLRGGIAATHAKVTCERTTVVRTATHITGLIEQARLPDRARDRALKTFTMLAEVEGRLHGRPPAQVHFHEVGALDSIIDIVGTCAALEILGIDEVRSGPVSNGMGSIRAAHGILPNPPPAVVRLLEGAPTVGLDIPLELTTPTGAALLAATVTEWGPMPAMTISTSGFGAGSRELEGRPNVTQVVVGTAEETLVTGQPILLFEVNVDDATGEALAHTMAQLLAAGANDAWITPILMKKGRPAHTVSALADPAAAKRIAEVMTAETGSLGIRAQRYERWPAAREQDSVHVEGHAIRVKVTAGRTKIEYEDAARVARQLDLPLREVIGLAETAWRAGRTGPHPL